MTHHVICDTLCGMNEYTMSTPEVQQEPTLADLAADSIRGNASRNHCHIIVTQQARAHQDAQPSLQSTGNLGK